MINSRIPVQGQLPSQFSRPPKFPPAPLIVSNHKLAHAAHYVLPRVPRPFKFGPFGVRWIYVRSSPPDRCKFPVHRAERAGECFPRCVSLFTELLPLKASLVLAH